ncbi:MAG: hypothetical protein MJY44_01345 [Bacteroidales bacterium]|nr:hypothetical protein [Bacteroidales bacterium]
MKKEIVLFAAAALTVGMAASCKKSERIAPKDEDVLPGVFSVSDTKKVQFSKGNLICDISGNVPVWAFGEHQYDCAENGAASASRISLFTWGYGPKSVEPYTGFYGNSFKDWGAAYCELNGIADGTWRTLTMDEWMYLFSFGNFHNDKRDKLFELGVTVRGVENCAILYPDGYDGVRVSRNNRKTLYNDNAAWKSAQEAGAVCLPAAGYRNESVVSEAGDGGHYWSSDAGGNDDAYRLLFVSDGGVQPDYFGVGNRGVGRSVRLVTEAK